MRLSIKEGLTVARINKMISLATQIGRRRKNEQKEKKSQKRRRHVLGSSGGVVNSLDFLPASLKFLGCFYFWCVLSSQWKAVTVNFRIFTLLTLKAFLEAHSQNVSGNKQ